MEEELLQNQEADNNTHDDFLDQILSSIPNCNWPSSNPTSSLLPHHSPPQLLSPAFHYSNPNSLAGEDGSLQALYNGFNGSFHDNSRPPNPPVAGLSSGGKSGGTAPHRQRVRARRGQATDPHSIAERIRRERIAERMKGLQELVPNGNKTDKASMLDEIIDYVKFLQLQVKLLSMSRLGGATAAAPLAADVSAEGGRNSNANEANDKITTEQQVAKLMEEDLGSAMQYLQRKGLCLMPISLATAISSATCQPRNLSSTHSSNDLNNLSNIVQTPHNNASKQ
ncbi:hypothetical protein RND81_09G200500 [Saponaria officinalis]|uniref:BHLH domain-containing protein n=1 Tax=Saponaria officinalis TaxID=3572 RepID=A0AAW1IN94_SAPOF